MPEYVIISFQSQTCSYNTTLYYHGLIEQEPANFFSKGQNGKYFGLCRPYGLCCTTPLECGGVEAATMCTSMSMAVFQQDFTKSGGKLDLAHGPWFANQCPRIYLFLYPSSMPHVYTHIYSHPQ